ncbi:MAG TPA: serine hydrolase, partial [Cyclobacteriaceae bacterium]|nr:serine hydrolase [Cyclobacteriaceae bacterium]
QSIVKVYPINERGTSNVKPSTTDSLLLASKRNFSALQIVPEAFGLSKKNLLPLPDRKTDQQSIKFRNEYSGLIVSPPVYVVDPDNFKKAGEAEKAMYLAGYDLIVDPVNTAAATRQIKRAIRKNKQELAQLDARVKRILLAKYAAGLHEEKHFNTDNLQLKLNPTAITLHQHEVYEQAITILNDQKNFLPIKQLDEKSFASVSFGLPADNTFNRYISKYTHIDHYDGALLGDTVNLTQKLSAYDVVIVSLFTQAPDALLIEWIKNLAKAREVIVCYFGEKNTLGQLHELPALVYAYTSDELMQTKAPQVIFGALPASGKLPYQVNNFSYKQGINKADLQRLSYGIPEATGMNAHMLERIDKIVADAIQKEATPGAYVLVAKDGKVIFDRAYGYHSYDQQIKVTENSIYDLASITKVAATTQMMMFLHEKGEIDINKKAAVYLPELKKSNKKDITIKDILTHQAGLWPFLPFWQQTLQDTSLMLSYYRFHPDDNFKFSVAPKLFTSIAMKDSLWTWVVKSKMREKTNRQPYDYRYSDMGMYILHKMAEKLINQNMNDFLDQNFYAPLGCYTTGYLPLERFKPMQITPTEDDKTFRKRLLVGTVHDQGAAMHGGVAGHAGLFSNANDLAKLGQMMLNNGYYGSKRYFKPETISLFTSKQYASSRRGIGWDKPTIGDWNTPTSTHASPQTFGHTGFTGTAMWMDPEFNLMYIFLSNRVHPDMNNNKLIQDNVRTRIHDVIYESIFENKKYQNDITWSKLK